MQTFKNWIENKIKIIKDPESGTQNLFHNNQEIGGFNSGYAGGDNAVAERMFPGIIKPREKVARIHGINIDNNYHGAGLGQLLYLRSFDKGGADWYYNSQTEPPATNALKALAQKKYIEIYWNPIEPNWDQEGRLHLVRITPLGREAYRQGLMVKKDKLK